MRVATTTWSANGATKQENLDRIYTYLSEASECHPDIVVLSESIYSKDSSGLFYETIPGPFTNAMSAKAKEYNMYIVANVLEDGSDGHKYDTNILFDRFGKIVGKYRKMRLTPGEAQNMTEGTTPEVFDTEFGKVAMEICYDVDDRFPEITKMHADLGAEIIFVSSWGDYNHSAAEFARQNDVFMATSVRTKEWDDSYPASAIIANDGTIINGINGPLKTCYADINLTKKTWSVPDPKWSHVTPPPVRNSIPVKSVTASDSLSGRSAQTLIDGYIDYIDAGPLKGLKGWSSDKKEPSVIFDLGSLRTVGSVGIVQYNACYQEDYIKLYFSQDGVSYDEYTNGYNYAARNLKDYNTGSPTTVYCYDLIAFPGYKYIEVKPSKNIRYIKIVGYGNNTQSYKNTNLTEVTVYEPLMQQVSPSPTPVITPTPSPTQIVTSTPPATIPPTTMPPVITPTPTAPATSLPSITPSPTPAMTSEPDTSPTVSPSQTAVVFNDISKSHWAYDYINSLAKQGIICGYKNDDGTNSFLPDNNITRAEFIKILVTSFNAYNSNLKYDSFMDVNNSDWYYSYVASAVKEGLTQGISADEFGSDDYLTREQLAVFIERALIKYKGYCSYSSEKTEVNLKKFADNDKIADYARPAVALLLEKNVVQGYTETGSSIFKPQNYATRAEVSVIADKAMNLEIYVKNF